MRDTIDGRRLLDFGNALFLLALAVKCRVACNLIRGEAYLYCSPPKREDASMTQSHKWNFSLAAAAAVSLFSLSSNAAEPVDSALSKTVKTWDLDLAKSADVQTLYTRVREAAHDVCTAEARRHWSSTRRPAPTGWRDSCVNEAVEAAVRDVGNRRLATLAESGSRALL
jgi:UrcA family protein